MIAPIQYDLHNGTLSCIHAAKKTNNKCNEIHMIMHTPISSEIWIPQDVDVNIIC